MNDVTVTRAREHAESELENAMFLRNIFVLTMLGAVGFVAGIAWVMVH